MASKDEEGEWVYYDGDQHLSDLWQELVDKGKVDDPVEAWLTATTDEDDVSPFVDYWRICVPRRLLPSIGRTSLDQRYDEELVKRVLLQPLDDFICGGANMEEVYRSLAEKDTPPALCGKVFALGDPIFSCRECSQDATCVMCSDCFQHSAHRFCRYKMSTSEGDGGYCDCGDEEAFTKHAMCDKHKSMNVAKTTSADSLAAFPADVRARADKLFRDILKYALYVTVKRTKKHDDLIIGAKDIETFSDLKYCFQYSTYSLILHNDDTHSFSDVVSVLQTSFTASPGNTSSTRGTLSHRKASEIAEYVDKVGRALLVVGDYRDCAAARDRVETNCRMMGIETPLKTSVIMSYLVAHQEFAFRLLQWLSEQFERCSGFRALMAEVFFREISLFRQLLTGEPHFWKYIRKAWGKIIIEAIMKEYDSKLKFAKIYVEEYDSIIRNFIADDQEPDVTVTNLTVQFFTVKSIAHELLKETDVFDELVNVFACRIADHALEYSEEDLLLGDQREFQAGRNLHLVELMVEQKAEYSRFESVLTDLMYLLRVPLESNAYDDAFRKRFCMGVQSFIVLLSYIQVRFKYVILHRLTILLTGL